MPGFAMKEDVMLRADSAISENLILVTVCRKPEDLASVAACLIEFIGLILFTVMNPLSACDIQRDSRLP